jgi:hypothetical protein
MIVTMEMYIKFEWNFLTDMISTYTLGDFVLFYDILCQHDCLLKTNDTFNFDLKGKITQQLTLESKRFES